MKFTNIEMEQHISNLKPLLERRDLVGYAAARNTRILESASVEYFSYREELIRKYGEEKENGEISLAFDSPKWKDFENDMREYALISHDVEVFKIPMKEAIGSVTGKELLDLWWMFEEDDDAS